MKAELKIRDQSITVQETLLDRAIRYLSPSRAQRRFEARMRTAVLTSWTGGGTGGYAGASRSKRSLSGWPTRQGSPDADLLPDLTLLAERSRDLARNSPLACGAINTVVTNVVGTGLKLQARINRTILNLTDEQADAWEALAEEEFRLWCESTDCDAQRTLNFYGLQDLALRSTLESGDTFTTMPYLLRPGSPYGLTLQVIEGDRVCNPDRKPDTSEVAAGIERNTYGAAVAYYIQDQHPGDAFLSSSKSSWTKVPAFGSETGRRNVLHLYKMLRPGQSRGVPYLAPVIEALKQLARYGEAELMAAVISGFLTVFVKSETDPSFQPMLPTAETGATSTDEDIKLGNGAVVGLSPGESVDTVNPTRPNPAFDGFVTSVLRQVGMALEIPYEVLIKHFTASYSAARAALLEAWKFFMTRRVWLAQNFCQPVYELWLEEAVASGRLPAPGFLRDPLIRKAYSGAEWTGPAKGMINEKDEVEAATMRISARLSTLDRETAELTGGDFESNIRQQKKERRMLQAAGLLPAKTSPSASRTAKDGSDEEQTDQSDVPEDELVGAGR